MIVYIFAVLSTNPKIVVSPYFISRIGYFRHLCPVHVRLVLMQFATFLYNARLRKAIGLFQGGYQKIFVLQYIHMLKLWEILLMEFTRYSEKVSRWDLKCNYT